MKKTMTMRLRMSSLSLHVRASPRDRGTARRDGGRPAPSHGPPRPARVVPWGAGPSEPRGEAERGATRAGHGRHDDDGAVLSALYGVLMRSGAVERVVSGGGTRALASRHVCWWPVESHRC